MKQNRKEKREIIQGNAPRMKNGRIFRFFLYIFSETFCSISKISQERKSNVSVQTSKHKYKDAFSCYNCNSFTFKKSTPFLSTSLLLQYQDHEQFQFLMLKHTFVFFTVSNSEVEINRQNMGKVTKVFIVIRS